MKLARVESRIKDQKVVGYLDGDKLWLTQYSSLLQVPENFEPDRTANSLEWTALLNGVDRDFKLIAPINPPEVWAFGFTYERGPQFAASPVIPSGPAYTAAINANRPEIFFKTTGFRVVGPNDGIGIRGDSTYTAVEAELCIILNKNMRPAFFTVGNDVSAWDIEARNPLYLAQCKTYEACCSLGPLAVTPEELPPDAEINCWVKRNGKVLFHGSISQSLMRWSYDELVNFAAEYNPLPEGTVLMVGTAIIRPNAEGLLDGDICEIAVDGIGTLVNRGMQLISPVPSSGFD